MTTFNDAIVEDVLVTIRNSEPWEIPARPAIDAKRARQMSLHVLYEIEALADIKRALWFDGRYDERDFPEGSIRRARGNGLLEAFALHVRALDDFLYKDQIASKGARRADTGNGQPVGRLRIDADCAIALDFVKDGQKWIDEKPPRHTVLDEARRRSNQHLIHLDWRRVEQVPSDAYKKGTTWPLDTMFDAIVPAILAFIEHVRHELVVPEFIRRALAIRERSHPDRADDAELGLDRPLVHTRD